MATTAAAVKEEPATRFAKDQLKAIIERIERLEEEKKTISDDIRDVYAGCASRTPTSAPSRKPSWKPICRRSGCCKPGALSGPRKLGQSLPIC